jgi:Methane oxygenase PmoA
LRGENQRGGQGHFAGTLYAAVVRCMIDCDRLENPFGFTVRSFMMSRLAIVGLVLLWVSNAAAAEPAVKLEKKAEGIAITIDGREFTTYSVSQEMPKPFFAPVRAADGAIVTRGLEKIEDHPHHRGIWCAIDEVNEIKFWAEKGKIVNKSVLLEAPAGNPARMQVENHWLGNDGQPLVIEKVRVAIFANRLMIYDLTFTAGKERVTFDDTKEGMFGIRLANSLRGSAGGKIANAEGLLGEKNCWGKESKWVDYYGPVEGKTYGVALLDHPKNFRKSRFHVRDYGLFTLSPFGQKAYTNGTLPADPFSIQPGQSARLRYGIYIHDGDTETGRVAEVYENFLKATAE